MLLKFSAQGCQPCIKLTDSLKRLGVTYKELDVSMEPELTAQYNIRGVPTMVCTVTHNKRVGMMSDREILEFVEKCNEV